MVSAAGDLADRRQQTAASSQQQHFRTAHGADDPLGNWSETRTRARRTWPARAGEMCDDDGRGRGRGRGGRRGASGW